MLKIQKSLTILIILVLLSYYAKSQIAVIETHMGNIELELYPEKAPLSVANFLDYINATMYDGGEFYRVVRMNNQPKNKIKIEVIQGGMGWDDSLPRLPAIAHETTNKTGLLHKTGTISMARNEPGSASSEFFICLSDQPELDYGGQRNPDGEGFAAFGKVIKGMEIVKQIQEMPDTNQFLTNPVKIRSVTIK